ncbi:protein of unknown function [Pseudodesulfovibrio piezophilus C1TLV30]|uniref:Uncharacterized protein n=1 Tax=Pseudodesulfovibrio piezophilus (strain DSM 21447 / JCM 15486 / C1TLV30) TaxID=1322246 RepID=M1WPS8_PSEP2|nr:protein of unknown function [Pseudodesulfovibrio piezophilus C1TLV30]
MLTGMVCRAAWHPVKKKAVIAMIQKMGFMIRLTCPVSITGISHKQFTGLCLKA